MTGVINTTRMTINSMLAVVSDTAGMASSGIKAGGLYVDTLKLSAQEYHDKVADHIANNREEDLEDYRTERAVEREIKMAALAERLNSNPAAAKLYAARLARTGATHDPLTGAVLPKSNASEVTPSEDSAPKQVRARKAS